MITNKLRACRVEEMVCMNEYYSRTLPEDPQLTLQEIICDLMHWCEEFGKDSPIPVEFELAVSAARTRFVTERRINGFDTRSHDGFERREP